MSTKQLKFTDNLVQPTLSGAKTKTFRLFDDKNLSVGDELELLRASDKSAFGRARITAVTEKKLGELDAVDYEGHGPIRSSEDTLRDFRSYYGDRVTLDTPVKVVTFELLK